MLSAFDLNSFGPVSKKRPARFFSGTYFDADHIPTLGKSVPWVVGKVPRAGRATAYVSRRGACKLPTSDAQVLQKQLQ